MPKPALTLPITTIPKSSESGGVSKGLIRYINNLAGYAGVAEIHRILTKKGWTLEKEISALIDIIEDSESSDSNRIKALSMLHARRMEALMLTGTIVNARKTMNTGNGGSVTVTAQLRNANVHRTPSAQPDKEIHYVAKPTNHPEHQTIEGSPNTGGPQSNSTADATARTQAESVFIRPATSFAPRDAESPGMRGLAYHHTARRPADGPDITVEDGGPGLYEDRDAGEGQVGSEDDSEYPGGDGREAEVDTFDVTQIGIGDDSTDSEPYHPGGDNTDIRDLMH